MELRLPTKIDNILETLQDARFYPYLLLSVLLILIMGVAAASFPFIILILFVLAVVGSFFATGILFRQYWIILLLVVFMPFEDFVIKYIPGPPVIRFGAQFASEVLIYLTALLVFLWRLRQGRAVRRSPIELPLIIFVFFAFISILLNRPPLFGSFVNVRSFLRYVVLFYLVINLDLSSKQIRRLLKIIVVIGMIQIAIGALQLLTGGAINQYLIPELPDLTVGGFTRDTVLLGRRGREIGSIFGTLGDTIFFALFLLVVMAIYLGKVHEYKVRHFLFIGIVFLATNFAYARAVIFGMLLMVLVFYRLRYGINRSLLLIVVVAPMFVGGAFAMANSSLIYRQYRNPGFQELSIVENITGIFTIEYVQQAQWQRLGALMGVPPTVLANRPFFGYGPDELTTIDRLNESYPSYLHKRLIRDGFEDVYWTATLAYYGVFGTLAFIALIYTLYRSAIRVWARSRDRLSKELAFTVACLVAVTPFLLFFYRVLEFRIYSFYLWLLFGLMINSYLSSEGKAVPS